MILRVASFPTKVCAQSPEAFQCLLGRRAYTTMPSSHGFDAYCRKAEQGGTVERICVALDVGLEMHDAFDARRPDGPTRLAVVLPALRTWITQKAALAPRTQWGLVVLRDAEAELLLAPTERDIMLATLNSVAQPRRRDDAFEEEDDGVADAPFDFSSLYNVLGDAFGTARPDGAVDRCLVVFGRSRAVPVATGEFTLKKKGGAFFLDAIYVHEKAAPPVRDVQAIYDALLKLLAHRSSYVMETTASQQKLQSYFLLLLAHPILRDAQDAALAKLDPEAAQRTASPPPPTAPPPPPG